MVLKSPFCSPGSACKLNSFRSSSNRSINIQSIPERQNDQKQKVHFQQGLHSLIKIAALFCFNLINSKNISLHFAIDFADLNLAWPTSPCVSTVSGIQPAYRMHESDGLWKYTTVTMCGFCPSCCTCTLALILL